MWLLGPAAWAQVDTVSLQIEPTEVGLDGIVRPGSWTPMRLALRNHAAEPREVVCRWIVRDFDGDAVHAERRVTLTPERTQQVWLYAAPAADRAARDPWQVQVLDGETGQLLARQQVGPRQQLDTSDNLIAVMSSADLGFEPFRERYTQHEAVQTLRGLALHDLPDRWYGLSTLQAIVWTREGGEPDDPRLTAAHQQALREWVRRGGQLVILWPTVGEAWTGSPLADLLPIGEDQARSVQRPLPPWAGSPRTDELQPVEYTTFRLVDDNDEPGVDVLRRDREGEPTVVARRYGFGRVTVVGVNFADRRLVQMGVPNGRFRIWHDVFHWQAPVYERDVIEAEMREGNISRPANREAVELGRFVPGVIAMRNTAGPVLLLAIFVFGIYWLLAGPIGFVLLRQKGWLHHSWLAFLAVVVVFSVVAWGGAVLVQPRQAGVAHFSVLDLDARTGQARTRSWLSLFVPEFGRAEVALGEPGTGRHTLANPGWRVGGPEAAGFLDPQTYTLAAGDPSRAAVPMRATAKQFTLDYFGHVGEDEPGMREPFPMPRGELRLDGHWPAGQLGHAMPGTLRDVLIVYCPGTDGSEQHRWMPWVWRHGDWAPGEVLELGGAPRQADRLVDRRHDFDAERNWTNEGFLGQLIARRTGQRFVDLEPMQVANVNEMIQAVEMLSFFAALPAPNFRAGITALGGRRAIGYERELGRALDLTPLITGRRVIIIGYLENSALPAPLTLNGRSLDADGWTVVRWVYDLD